LLTGEFKPGDSIDADVESGRIAFRRTAKGAAA
jgi:hypothetical protein